MLARLTVGLFTCAIAATLCLSSVEGAQKGTGKGTGKKQPCPFAKQIYELHDVRVLLESADHDYKGHRAEAVKLIHTAIHSMNAGYAHVKHPSDNAKGGGEPQALSDKQLQESIDKLNRIGGQLTGGQANANLQGAATALTSAVAELKTALTIK